MKAQHAPATLTTAERWGHRWPPRVACASGRTVCVMGDPTQGSLFDDVELHQLRDAALIACAPRLAAALADCANRLERCCAQGSAAEYSHLAVREYRQLLAEPRTRTRMPGPNKPCPHSPPANT